MHRGISLCLGLGKVSYIGLEDKHLKVHPEIWHERRNQEK